MEGETGKGSIANNNSHEVEDDAVYISPQKEPSIQSFDDDSDDASFHSIISLSDDDGMIPPPAAATAPIEAFQQPQQLSSNDSEEDEEDLFASSTSSCLFSSAHSTTFSSNSSSRRSSANNSGGESSGKEEAANEEDESALPILEEEEEEEKDDATTLSINFKSHTNVEQHSQYETWKLLTPPPTSSNTHYHHRSSPNSKFKNNQKKRQPRPKINSISFNHTKDCIVLSTSYGCRVRTLLPTLTSSTSTAEVLVHDVHFPHEKASTKEKGGTLLSRMLHRTSLLTIVPTSTPRTLHLLDARKPVSSSQSYEPLKTLHFTHAIRRIENNKSVLLAVTADGTLHVFQMNESLQRIKSISLLHDSESPRKMTTTGDNLHATTWSGSFFDLSLLEEESYLVCRSNKNEERGEFKGNVICVYDTKDMKLMNQVKAHNHHEVSKICIGGWRRGGQRVATCSSKGTVIRIFGPLPQLNKLYTLYRGSNPCTMYYLSFNTTATKIACSGSTGTIHLFDLEKGEEEQKKRKKMQQLKKKGSSSKINLKSVLFPDSLSDKTDGIRSYAKIRLKAGDDDEHGDDFDYHYSNHHDEDSVCSNNASPNRRKKKKKKKKISPNAIAILDNTSSNGTAAGGGNNSDTVEVVVCTENGRLCQYQVDGMNGYCRPVTAEDVMFDEEEYEEEYGIDC